MPFQPGKSGNPAGTPGPKGVKQWRDAIRAVANEINPKTKRKRLLDIADAIFKAAAAGDTSAAREIGDRLDGKAMQEITGEDGGPINVAGKLTIEFVKPDKADAS